MVKAEAAVVGIPVAQRVNWLRVEKQGRKENLQINSSSDGDEANETGKMRIYNIIIRVKMSEA